MELIILACMFINSGPPECREYAIDMSDATPFQCMFGQQIHLAQWSADHPSWTIKRFRCARKTGKA